MALKNVILFNLVYSLKPKIDLGLGVSGYMFSNSIGLHGFTVLIIYSGFFKDFGFKDSTGEKL